MSEADDSVSRFSRNVPAPSLPLGHYSATVVHQLRNFLAGISATVQLMEIESRHPLHNSLEEQIGGVTNYLDDLSSFSPRQVKKDQSVDLMALVEEMANKVCGATPSWHVKVERMKASSDDLRAALSSLLKILLHPTPERNRIFIGSYSFIEKHEIVGEKRYAEIRMSQSSSPLREVPAKQERASLQHSGYPGAMIGMAVSRGIFRCYGCQLRLQQNEVGAIAFSILIPL